MANEEMVERKRLNDATKVALAWLAVGLPLVWGVIQTVHKAVALFR